MDSKYLSERVELGKKLVNKLLEKYEYVSLLGKHVYGKSFRTMTTARSIEDTMEAQCGFVVKVFNQGIYSEYSFGELEENLIDNIVNSVEKELKLSKNILENHMNLSLLDDEPLVKDFNRPSEGRELSNKEVIDALNETIANIQKEDPRIVMAMAMAEHYTVNSFFISRNRCLTQSFSWSMIFPMALIREEQNMKYVRKGFVGNNFEELLAKACNSAKDVADAARAMIKAESIEPGEYDIITHPSITGLIAHEAFGHGVEMDMFVKNRAKSRLYLNKPVASKLVSMHDGAAATYSCASYFFDDDGVLAQDTLIIDKGILKTGICDVIAANELGTKPTGNSRRESAYRKAYTRMTNTFFEPGEDNLEDMIKSIKHGYMLFETNNGMEDPKNWNIQCVAEYAKEIKDGKFTGKIVSPVVMSGYVPDLLMSISAVSKDFEVIGAGHCGKGHKEWVPVSDGGPYLKARCKLS